LEINRKREAGRKAAAFSLALRVIILHLSLLKWYKFGVGTGMGLQDIGSR